MSPDDDTEQFAEGIAWTASMAGRDMRCPRCGFEHADMLCGHMGSDARWVCLRCFYHPGWFEKASPNA
jgi:transposase-like protein